MSRVALLAAASSLVFGVAARAEEPQDLSEVVVTAAPYVVSIQSTTTSVDVVKREELDLAPAAGLGDVLASVPGVRSSFFGPGSSRPVIRGLSGPRVLVLTNGVGLIDASGLSPDHQVASDPQEAERIEVLRGPSALAYGGSAIGGVVNVIDNRIPTAYRAGLHGRALAEYSSVDHGRQLSGALQAGLGGGLSLTVDGSHRRTKDYEVPVAPGKVANSFVDLDAYGAGLSWVGEAVWAGASVKRTQTDYGSPAEEDVSIGLRQTRVDVRGGADLGGTLFDKLKITGGWANYKHTEFEGPEPGTTFLSKGYEGRIELVQADRGGWQGAVGVQGLRRTFDAIGEEALIPFTKIDELGAFTLQRYDAGGWGLEGGLRVDSRSIKNVRADRDLTNLSATVAVFVRPSEHWFVGLSLARTSRAPTEEELSSRGAHPATGAFEIGDPALGKEVSWSADASAHHTGGPWSFDAHLFYVDYDRYIDQFATGEIDAESGFPIFRFVQTGAKFYGFEAEAGRDIWKDGERSLRFETGADYVHGEAGSGPAPRIPPWALTGRAIYETGALSSTLEVRRTGQQSRVTAFETPTGGYTLVNASLVWRPVEDKPDLKVFVEGRNLTDVEAREHASFLKAVAPLPGRSLRLGVGYRF